MAELLIDTLLDALLDTLKLFPFLLLIYVLIELMEKKTSLSTENSRLKGNLGVLVGSATGLIPQCGFSVMAAKLYDSGYIALGTLFAIFISTSDEAFIILLSSGQGALSLLPIVMVKIVVGVAVGYLLNFALKLYQKKTQDKQVPVETVKFNKADYHSRIFQKKEEGFCTSCGREHNEEHPVKTYLVSPALHSLKIAAYIFGVTAAFGFLVALAGEDNLMNFLNRSALAQPFLTAFIGLIPNCAGSVIITQSFLLGRLTFGGCIAGLCANAGLGLVVLLKNTQKWKRNLLLIAGLYIISVLTGIAATFIAPVFGW